MFLAGVRAFPSARAEASEVCVCVCVCARARVCVCVCVSPEHLQHCQSDRALFSEAVTHPGHSCPDFCEHFTHILPSPAGGV